LICRLIFRHDYAFADDATLPLAAIIFMPPDCRFATLISLTPFLSRRCCYAADMLPIATPFFSMMPLFLRAFRACLCHFATLILFTPSQRFFSIFAAFSPADTPRRFDATPARFLSC